MTKISKILVTTFYYNPKNKNNKLYKLDFILRFYGQI